MNSRHIAEVFEKRHADVLRDIGNLELNAELRSVWFRQSSYRDPTGRELPSFDLTRQGFTLLVMGWTGEKAMAFKVRYIEAFDAMEAALNTQTPITGRELISAVREIVAPLAVRFDGQDRAIERVEQKVDLTALKVVSLDEAVRRIDDRLNRWRREINASTKLDHIEAVEQLGGRCPCGCGREVVKAGIKLPDAQFDHFYAASKPDAEHTWLIHTVCHSELTRGSVMRHKREAAFRAYQDARARLPGRQPRLF